MKKVLIICIVALISACNKQAECLDTVVLKTPQGEVKVVNSPAARRYIQAINAAYDAEKNLDKPMVNKPSEKY
ncbi:hypothetical protein [Microbulbifer discodermiae]|uniref:hypothetical protein n=1 Tax=Microbulbifer sp. 2201CG32-9 TaxID=3232309 RepID=UPI00345BA6A9